MSLDSVALITGGVGRKTVSVLRKPQRSSARTGMGAGGFWLNHLRNLAEVGAREHRCVSPQKVDAQLCILTLGPTQWQIPVAVIWWTVFF
jgi:hypothetical protein